MTVQFETPTVAFTGDGAQTFFDFNWSSQDRNELIVELDDVVLTEGVEYEFLDADYYKDRGGRIEMRAAPVPGSRLLLYRQTPITQETTYEQFKAFPAETHEGAMDKDTRILQEIIEGGRAIGGRVDLSAVHNADNVTIENTGGSDAVIEPWECQLDEAGVFIGEVTTSAPADGDPTTKPDGYIWIELA